jgi:hypothetical protein
VGAFLSVRVVSASDEAAARAGAAARATPARPTDGGPPDAAPAPLKAWMETHAAPPLVRGDLRAAADAFEAIAHLLPAAPQEYPYWRSIALDGAAAARAGHLEGAKAACRGCHVQYRAKYAAARRARSLGAP